MADLTLRSVKGSPLTNTELDGNFEYFTGSHAVTGSLTVTEDLIVSGSIIGNISGSVLITTNTGVQITGSLVVSGSNTFTNIGPMKTGADNNVAAGFAFAQGSMVSASGLYSHAEGFDTNASGTFSHAEGQNTLSQGGSSHAEGVETSAIGDFSHAEGYGTISSGYASHAEGYFTLASASYQHAQGIYNIASDVTGAFIIGNGSGPSSRSNLIFAAGNQVQITGSLVVTGGITGSFSGTITSSSFATTSSYALTAQTLLGSVTSASYAATASVLLGSVTSASYAATASYTANAQQATSVYTFATDTNSTYYPAFVGASFSSYNTLTVDSGGQFSYNPSTNTLTVPNIEGTSSYALTAQTLLGSVTSASFATTASYISPTFISASAAASGFGSGGGSINTSSLATTGSNSFSGNQTVTGSVISTLGFTGSLLGTSTTASYVDPSFAFNGGTIDAAIYFSPNNTNADQSLVFTNVTDTVNGDYSYPNWSDDFTLTYNPQQNNLKLTGSLIIRAVGEVVIITGLPNSEPSTSGQLWLSGSAGSNSQVLCVRG
jgi:hypothetical protein